MKLDLDNASGKQIVNAYEPQKITINGTNYSDNLIITPEEVISPWPASELAQISITDFDIIIGRNPELIILGTGETFQIPPAKLRADLFQHKIGLEFMDSHAACRTYNILALEERRVVAALLI